MTVGSCHLWGQQWGNLYSRKVLNLFYNAAEFPNQFQYGNIIVCAEKFTYMVSKYVDCQLWWWLCKRTPDTFDFTNGRVSERILK